MGVNQTTESNVRRSIKHSDRESRLSRVEVVLKLLLVLLDGTVVLIHSIVGKAGGADTAEMEVIASQNTESIVCLRGTFFYWRNLLPGLRSLLKASVYSGKKSLRLFSVH
jgi:hypothetical protein